MLVLRWVVVVVAVAVSAGVIAMRTMVTVSAVF